MKSWVELVAPSVKGGRGLKQERVNDNARKKAEGELINEGLIEEEEK